MLDLYKLNQFNATDPFLLRSKLLAWIPDYHKYKYNLWSYENLGFDEMMMKSW